LPALEIFGCVESVVLRNLQFRHHAECQLSQLLSKVVPGSFQGKGCFTFADRGFEKFRKSCHCQGR